MKRDLVRESDSIFIVDDDGRRYQIIQDRLIVKPKSETERSSKDVLEDLNILSHNPLGYISISVPEGMDVEDYASTLEKTGVFESVDYDSFGEYHAIPNDTDRVRQWNLTPISAFFAWGITTGNPNVRVAIIDSGTDWRHPDLGVGTDGFSNIDASLGWNFEAGNSNVITANRHGTLVAGITGAKTNNARGIAGITGGWR